MKGFSQELKVGLFMLLGLAVFFFMTFKVGSISFTTGEGRKFFYVYFNNISGVVEKSHVKMAGVRIGEVNSITLEDNRAKVMVNLEEGFEVPNDSVATVRSAGLLGEKYIDIKPGSSKTILTSGQVLEKSVDPSDIDEMVGKLSAALDDIKIVTASLRDSFGTKEGKEGLKSIIKNFSEVSENLNNIISGNTDKLNSIIDNVDKASSLLQEILSENQRTLKSTLNNFEALSAILTERAPDLIEHLDAAAIGINDMVAENRGNLKEGLANARELLDNLNAVAKSLKQIMAKIEKGEGTIGKLVQDDTVYENLSATLKSTQGLTGKMEELKIGVGARVERQFELEENKSYFSLRIQPREDKYYLFEITEDIREPNLGGRNALNSMLYTFEIAKRFGDLTFKGGLMESSGALGLDYHMLNDSFRVSADLFNFSGYDINAPNPQVKLTARYYPQKYVYFYVGGDELLNDYYKTFIAGAGLMVNEDDIKFLFGLFR